MGLKLDELIKNVNKTAKEEIITVGLNDYSYKRIPFTSPRMNYCTFGGIPVGKITEFYGEEHGGKTTTALDIVANYQHMDDAREVLYIDAENTLDVNWAKKIGVDVERMIIMQPKSQSAEQIFQIICDAVETDEVGLWVLDSIGVLMSQQEWDKTLEDKTYGGISKPLTQFSKRVESLMARHNCTGIGINQMREVIGSQFPMQTTPGGKAWKHCCAVRMQFSRGKFIDEKGNELTRGAENPAGNIVLMNMTKNKSCPPTRRIGMYTLNYHTGIDYLKDLVYMAIQFGIIDKKGAWFTITNIESGEVIADKMQGQASVYSALTDDAMLLETVETMVDNEMYKSVESD